MTKLTLVNASTNRARIFESGNWQGGVTQTWRDLANGEDYAQDVLDPQDMLYNIVVCIRSGYDVSGAEE